jgi:hypothetical protein
MNDPLDVRPSEAMRSGLWIVALVAGILVLFRSFVFCAYE